MYIIVNILHTYTILRYDLWFVIFLYLNNYIALKYFKSFLSLYILLFILFLFILFILDVTKICSN